MGSGFSVEWRRLWPRRRLAHHFSCPDPVPGSSPRADRPSSQRAGSFAQLIEPGLGMSAVPSLNRRLVGPPAGRNGTGCDSCPAENAPLRSRLCSRRWTGSNGRSHRLALFRIAFIIAFVIAFISGLAASRLFASGKLSLDERIELERGLSSEIANAKMQVPRSKKALTFSSDGRIDDAAWQKAQREFG